MKKWLLIGAAAVAAIGSCGRFLIANSDAWWTGPLALIVLAAVFVVMPIWAVAEGRRNGGTWKQGGLNLLVYIGSGVGYILVMVVADTLLR